jgi:hypothetical protein
MRMETVEDKRVRQDKRVRHSPETEATQESPRCKGKAQAQANLR